jgi:hypothetical protein
MRELLQRPERPNPVLVELGPRYPVSRWLRNIGLTGKDFCMHDYSLQ